MKALKVPILGFLVALLSLANLHFKVEDNSSKLFGGDSPTTQGSLESSEAIAARHVSVKTDTDDSPRSDSDSPLAGLLPSPATALAPASWEGFCNSTPPPIVIASGVNASSWCPLPCQCGYSARGGGVGTSVVACAPHFLIIGANKAGTSSLYHYLGAHPSVRLAGRKELHFWTFRFSTRPHKLQKYLANFSAASHAHEEQLQHRFCRKTNQPRNDHAACAPCDGPSSGGRGDSARVIVTGEATPDLHYYPLAPLRIAALLPSVRAVLLRRPAFQLAFSTFGYNRGRLSSPKNLDRFQPLAQAARVMQRSRPVTAGRARGLAVPKLRGNGSEPYFARVVAAIEGASREASREARHGESQSLAAASAGASAAAASAKVAAGKSVFGSLRFEDWVALFALEVDACLSCAEAAAAAQSQRAAAAGEGGGGGWSELTELAAACNRTPQLVAQWPSLYRHAEDVPLPTQPLRGAEARGHPAAETAPGPKKSIGGRLGPADQCW